MKSTIVILITVIFLFMISPCFASLPIDEAVDEFSQRLGKITSDGIDKDDAEDYFELGKFCIKNGLLERAKVILEKAAGLDPKYQDRVEHLLADIKDKEERGKDLGLIYSAYDDYNLGYYGEAKIKLEELIEKYEESEYVNKAENLLDEMKNKTEDKPFLLTPVTDNPMEFRKFITDIIKEKAKERNCDVKEIDVSKVKEEYLSNLIKKAEYFISDMTAKSNGESLNQDYLFFAMKCTEVVFKLSENEKLKEKTKDIQTEAANKLFTEYPLPADIKNLDLYYKRLQLVDNKEIIKNICEKYLKLGNVYLERANESEGRKKIDYLVKAYDVFAMVKDYAKSDEIKNKAFRKIKLIQKEKRKEVRKLR